MPASGSLGTKRLGRDKSQSNLLQDLDLDEGSLGDTANQIRKSLNKQMIRNVDFFQQLDDNGSGYIDKRELVRGFKQLGLNIPPMYLEQLFDNFDVDRSGKIHFEELKHTLAEGRMKLNVEELPPEMLAGLTASNEAEEAASPTVIAAPAVALQRRIKSFKGVSRVAKEFGGYTKHGQASQLMGTVKKIPFRAVRVAHPPNAPDYDIILGRAPAFEAYEHVADPCGTNRGSAQLAICTHPLQNVHGDKPVDIAAHSPFHHNLVAAGWSILAFDTSEGDGTGDLEAEKLRSAMAYVARHRFFRYCRIALLTQGTSASAALAELHRDPKAFDPVMVLAACEPSGKAALQDKLLRQYRPYNVPTRMAALPMLVTHGAASSSAAFSQRLHAAHQGPKTEVNLPPSYRDVPAAYYYGDHPKRLTSFAEEHSQPAFVKSDGTRRMLVHSKSFVSSLGLPKRKPQLAPAEPLGAELPLGMKGSQSMPELPVLEPIRQPIAGEPVLVAAEDPGP